MYIQFKHFTFDYFNKLSFKGKQEKRNQLKKRMDTEVFQKSASYNNSNQE
jgi:hypothetical protein